MSADCVLNIMCLGICFSTKLAHLVDTSAGQICVIFGVLFERRKFDNDTIR